MGIRPYVASFNHRLNVPLCQFNKYFIAYLREIVYHIDKAMVIQHIKERMNMQRDYIGVLSENISRLRRQASFTQEELANKLGITFQAVSKWETGACSPDLALLPQLAEIFDVSVDSLFGLDEKVRVVNRSLPWDDDDRTLHIAVFRGHRHLEHCDGLQDYKFELEGDALNVDCAMNLNCGDVDGNANAGGGMNCGDVGGSANCGGGMNCGDVGGGANCGGGMNCGDVGNSANCGGAMSCGDVGQNASCGGALTCGDIGGDAKAGGDITAADIGGDVNTGGDITAADVGGDVRCNNLECADIDGDVNCVNLKAADINGDVKCESLQCNEISGDVNCKGDIRCEHISGDIRGYRE